ncbi:hypothetical protein L0128_11735 [candidate division KSB1 bacterium]|nr:hypothetical protein [candidate division KSB1 bacterium]
MNTLHFTSLPKKDLFQLFFQIHVDPAASRHAFLAHPAIDTAELVLPLTNLRLLKSAFQNIYAATSRERWLQGLYLAWYTLTRGLKKRLIFGTENLTHFLEYVGNQLTPMKRVFFGLYGDIAYETAPLTWQLMQKSGDIIGYLKIGDSKSSRAWIRNEYQVCEQLSAVTLVNAVIPKNLYWGNWKRYPVLVQAPITEKWQHVGLDLWEQLVVFLLELIELTGQIKRFDKSGFHRSLTKELARLGQQASPEVKTVLNLVEAALKRLSPYPTLFGVAHGNMLPANVRKLPERLQILDWKFARQSYPPFFDLFNFVFEGYFQFKQLPVQTIITDKIFKHANNRFRIQQYAKFLQIPFDQIPDFFTVYLFDGLIFEQSQRPEQNLEANHFFQALQSWSQSGPNW